MKPMTDVTITVPEDIVLALLLPPDAVELQRERGLGALPAGHLPGRRRHLQG